MKRRVIVTIDVEAQPPRATADHVNRLIYGTFGGRSFGIGKMFDIADRHNMRLTAFIDYCGVSAHGEQMLHVGRYTRLRGHDPQLHMHPEYLAAEVWGDVTPQWNGLELSIAQADFLVQFLLEQHQKTGGQRPLAYRGGGFRYNVHLLKALAGHGVRYDFSYNPGVANQKFNAGSVAPFRWVDAPISEIPVTCLKNFNNTPGFLQFNFNSPTFLCRPIETARTNFKKYLEEYFRLYPDGIATLVLHSWSLLNRDRDGKYFVSINDYAADVFAEFCAIIARDYDPVCVQDLAASDYTPAEERKYQPAGIPLSEAYKCPVCGADESALADHAGIRRRRCTLCGSLERQRTLAILTGPDYLGSVLQHKRVLHLAAQDNEKRILAAIPGIEAVSLDIRPDLKPDIVADLTDLSGIPAESFDVILASEVFSHVEKLDQALGELARVLKTDGLLLQWDFTREGKPTREYTDLGEITRYYGMEAYRRYRVGRFRYFGDLDIDTRFSPHFERRAYRIYDEATNTLQLWNCWRKKAAPPLIASSTRSVGETVPEADADSIYEAVVILDDEPHEQNLVPERTFFIARDSLERPPASCLYGFALADGSFVTGSYSGELNPGSEALGCYTRIMSDGNNVTLSVDSSGFGALYLYQCGDYWAFSNSLARLIREMRRRDRPVTLNSGFAAQCFAACATPLTAGDTLCQEISLLPSTTSARLQLAQQSFRLEEQPALELVPAASAEGLTIIDKWLGKWLGIIRSLAESGIAVRQDITGGRDSRIVLALTLAAGIPPDRFTYQCLAAERSEDYRIAQALCGLNRIRLNARPAETYAADYDAAYGLFTDFKKYLHTLGSDEPVEAQPVVRLSGAAGELHRGAWRMPMRQYASWFTRRYGPALRREAYANLLDAALRVESLAAARNFAASEPVLQLLYSLSRMRWHFGSEAVACFYRNQYVFAPLADPLLALLHLEGCASSDFIFAYILRRLAPGLACLPYDKQHIFSPEVQLQADNVCRAMPPLRATDYAPVTGFGNLRPFVYARRPAGESSVRKLQMTKISAVAAIFNRHFPPGIIADELANRLQHGSKLEYILAVSELLEPGEMR